MASSRKLPLAYNESTYGDATRDYTSLAAWESATDTDLVTAAEGAMLTCYDDSAPYNDTVDVSGATTSADYFRVIRAASGQQGTPTDGVRFVVSQTAADTTLAIIKSSTEDYSSFYDLAVKGTLVSSGGSGNVQGFRLVRSDNVIVAGCCVYDCDVTGTASSREIRGIDNNTSNNAVFVNNVVKNLGSADASYGILFYSGSGTTTAYAYNNTVIDGGGYGFKLLSIIGTTIIVYSKNCIVQNNASGTFLLTGAGTETHYQTTNATSGVTFDTDGYHLDSTDTGAIDSGTDLSADATFAFNDDIDGDTRSGTWDIGADEYIAAASGFIPKLFWYM